MKDKETKNERAKTLFIECSEEEKNKIISFLRGDREAFAELELHNFGLLPECR